MNIPTPLLWITLCFSAACHRDAGPETHPAPESTASSVPGAPKAAVANPVCSPDPGGYSIRIDGDGPPQDFRAGAVRIPNDLRACEPEAIEPNGELIVSACAEIGDPRRSCFWSREHSAAYFDRDGIPYQLAIKQRTLTATDSIVDGSFEAKSLASRNGKVLELKIQVHVGKNIPAFRQQGIWGTVNY